MLGVAVALMGDDDFIAGDGPTIADIAAYGEIGQCLPEFFTSTSSTFAR